MDLTAVAWVPDDDPNREWNTAAGLAAEWVHARCLEEKAAGLLVANTMRSLGVPALTAFERQHTRTSRRADRVDGRGPVLSYTPHAEDLGFAMDQARGSSMAVVETAGFPLGGWAAQLGALNLITGATTPSLPEHVIEAVDRLAFHGNNCFTDDFGKRTAQTILADLDASSVVLLPSAVIAAGVPADGAVNLQRLMAEVG